MTQAGYSGTPLLQKLGVREGSRMAVIKPPPGFVHSLPGLPKAATLSQRGTSQADVIVWFIKSSRELEEIGSAIDETWSGLRLSRRRAKT